MLTLGINKRRGQPGIRFRYEGELDIKDWRHVICCHPNNGQQASSRGEIGQGVVSTDPNHFGQRERLIDGGTMLAAGGEAAQQREIGGWPWKLVCVSEGVWPRSKQLQPEGGWLSSPRGGNLVDLGIGMLDECWLHAVKGELIVAKAHRSKEVDS